MRPRAKCHPQRAHASRGMCHSCYSTWRYNHKPEYREARLAASKARQKLKFKRKRRLRIYKPAEHDVPREREGFTAYVHNITAKETASLNACLKRRGLARELSAMGGWTPSRWDIRPGGRRAA